MKNKKSPFEINEKIMTDVIEIGELVGRASISSNISHNPTLRRTNRIRTIYSSLAIEQNTLDIEQVTAI
ncbi:MAG: Fic family protein, partial [Clostridia bacterium]|nr:Fic family protein [Clostridia bacterium]